jgi:alkanesulfonate monooxygenase
MPVEIIGMVGTRDASEIKGPLVDGPVVDWTDGPVIDPAYLIDISQAHEQSGFDRVLVGYGAVGPEGWAVAASVLQHTERLKVLVAHRPGFVQPVLLARMAATLDHLTGGDRIAIHFITGGDEADQRREGDFVPHDDRYRRTGEMMSIVRRIWREDAAFDFEGDFYRYEGAFSSVKPVSPDGIPLYFAGASSAAIAVGAVEADVYAFWGEPRDAVAERMATIGKVAASAGRALRYSISLRPIIADTEDEAWRRLNGSPRRRPDVSPWPRSGRPEVTGPTRGCTGRATAHCRRRGRRWAPLRSGANASSRCRPSRRSTTSACG